MKQYQLVRSFAQGTQQPGLNLELLNEFKIIHPKDPEKGREIAFINAGPKDIDENEVDYESPTNLKNYLRKSAKELA